VVFQAPNQANATYTSPDRPDERREGTASAVGKAGEGAADRPPPRPFAVEFGARGYSVVSDTQSLALPSTLLPNRIAVRPALNWRGANVTVTGSEPSRAGT
jgi:hypothetical protein